MAFWRRTEGTRLGLSSNARSILFCRYRCRLRRSKRRVSVTWCPCRKPYPAWQSIENRTMIVRNEGSLQAHWLDGCRLIRSRVMLEAEIWTLRQQINVLRRTAPKKLSFCAVDRMIFVGLYRLFPKICDELG